MKGLDQAAAVVDGGEPASLGAGSSLHKSAAMVDGGEPASLEACGDPDNNFGVFHGGLPLTLVGFGWCPRACCPSDEGVYFNLRASFRRIRKKRSTRQNAGFLGPKPLLAPVLLGLHPCESQRVPTSPEAALGLRASTSSVQPR